MNLRERYDYIDLIPIHGCGLDYEMAYADVEAAFVFRDYAALKTLFGQWIQAGDN